MSEYNFTDKTLKFVTVNTKEFHENKQYIELVNVDVDKIVILGRFKSTHKVLSMLLDTKLMKWLKICVLFCHRCVCLENGGR